MQSQQTKTFKLIRGSLVFIFLVTATQSRLCAQSNPDSSDLGKDRFQKRQRATMELWQKRGQSREEVQRAARHPDPEIADRAKWVLRQWRRGVVPGMSPKISQLLQSDDPAVIERLLDLGEFKAAAIAVEESSGTVQLEGVQDRITRAMVRRFPIYIALAVKDDSLQELLNLVDVSATSPEMALCRIQLMQHLKLPINDAELLPKSSETWTEQLRRQAEVLILFHLKRNELATELAREFGDQAMLISALLLNRNWDELAQLHYQSAIESDPDALETSRHWADLLTAAHRGGNQDLVQKAVMALAKKNDEEISDTNGLDFVRRWRALAMHGFIDEALQLLEQDPNTATEIALVSQRITDAVEILGYDFDQIDSDLESWIDQAIESQQSQQAEFTEDFKRITGLMRVLLRLEYDQEAWAIASRIAKADDSKIRFRPYLFNQLMVAGKEEWVLKLAVRENERTLAPGVASFVADALPDCNEATFRILLSKMQLMSPGKEFAEYFGETTTLIQGNEAPKSFGNDRLSQNQAFRQLYESLANNMRPRQISAQKTVLDLMTQMNDQIVKMFRRHSQTDLAQQGLIAMVAEQGNAEACLSLAEDELLRGRVGDALLYLDNIWNLANGNQKNPQTESTMVAKALVLRWMIAKRRGDLEQAEQLGDQLKLTLYSPSSDMRSEVAEFLVEKGHVDLARETFDQLIPISVYGSIEVVDLYSTAFRFALAFDEEDPKAAAQCFDMAISTTVDWSPRTRSSIYIRYPSFATTWALEGAIADKDQAAIEKHSEQLLRLNGMNIDYAERLLPKMREIGMNDYSDRVLNTVFDNGLAHIKAFPFDATLLNNIAWAGAMNKKRLDESLELSQKACFLEPDSAVFRDTLAELLYLRGDTRQALSIEKQCVIDDAGEWEFHQKVKKYTAELNDPALPGS